MRTIADVKIDEEFEALIPPMTAEEFRQLQANVEADGRFREKLVAWHGLIADGNNRHKISKLLPDIPPPEIEELDLPSREAVINWIIDNQLGRRNLPEKQRTYLLGKKYNLEKMKAKDNLTPGPGSSNVQIGPSKETSEKPTKTTDGQPTAERLAEGSNTSPRTVRRSGDFATAIDAIRGVNPKFAAKLLTGDLKVDQQTVIDLGKLDGLSIKAGIKKLNAGEKPDLKNGRKPKSATTRAKKSAKPATRHQIFKPLLDAIGKAGRELDAATSFVGGEVEWADLVHDTLSVAIETSAAWKHNLDWNTDLRTSVLNSKADVQKWQT